MTPTSRLYDALHDYLSQCQSVWRDVRHLQTLCWMMIGIIQSQNVHQERLRGVCCESGNLRSVSSTTVSTVAVESAY